MAPATKKIPKPVFKTADPYTATTWPEISHDDQHDILELLCSLLEPLGHHRKTHIQPSRGKKRKRNAKVAAAAAAQDPASGAEDADMADAPPPPPELSRHVLVGLNSVTRHLEALAAKSAPPTMKGLHAPSSASKPGEPTPPDQKTAAVENTPSHRSVETKGDPAQSTPIPAPELRSLSLVIIPHPAPQTSPVYAHLPTLLHLSALPPSPQTAADNPTRLVPLQSSSESRLAEALHIPRVGAIGILADAPGTMGLVDYVRERVGPTQCRWVDEALNGGWGGVKVSSSAA
ncbi:hypothetical protein BS50DRAFT_566807 [Corynespora cassiicola Philippines]|uniref:Uncharacterized protein n=1 Tax=Corynespora cassiicola Philippines TaxID=1448308 RepID=A0A2T2P897_CORCC|nr:hypothetical protein BS50DRAFT_566807 [Corynespora cassiicola Philippines]